MTSCLHPPASASVEMTDDDLLTAIARRETAAFEKLYDRYARSAYSLALGMLGNSNVASEVVQEIFLSIWKQAERYEKSRGSARSWILAVAHHKSVDALRRQKVRVTEEVPPHLSDEQDVMADALRKVEGQQVREALKTLPEPQKESIALAYFAGLSHQEISARTNTPLGTIKTRIRDGMQRLRARLQG